MTSVQPPLHVSVSIINYRTAEMTQACVRSVLEAAAEVPDLRVSTIVVDNASGDGSADLIAAWIDEEGHADAVELIRSPINSGFSGGHNQGIAACDSDYVLILNSDAALRPGFFAPLMEAVRAHPEAGFFSPRLEEPDGAPQIGGFRWHTPVSELIRGASTGLITKLFNVYNVPIGTDPDPDEVDWVSFACVLISRAMIDAIGPMDEGFFLYFEDCEYSLRGRRAGYAAVLVPQARAMHVGGGSGPVETLKSAKKRLPEYYYRSRSRFFYLAHGRMGLLASNLMWHLGRCIAGLRVLVGKPVPDAHEREALDIWAGFLAPMAKSGRPGP